MQIEIFKTGTHTDASGNTRAWTEADLNVIAEKYNSQKAHESPVVIGHPKDNAPAYGWVESLRTQGGVLYADLKDLTQEFKDWVKQGLYKKRSISLYPDMTLRHIGFLGAMPPAIKGLADVSFGDGGGVIIEFEENKNKKEEKAMKFFEWLKGLAAKEGVTLEDMPAAQSFSEADIQVRIDAELKKKAAQFSERLKAEGERLKTREDALQAKEEMLKQVQHDTMKKEIASFCEGLAKQGILTPAMQKHGMGIQNFLEQISAIETTIEFGEGGKKEKQTPVEFIKSFLSELPKQIEFGEVAGRGKDIGKGLDKAEVLISDFMEKSKDASYRDAVLAVSKEHPDLFKGGN